MKMDSAVRKVYEAATHKVYCEACGWHGTFNQVDQVQDPRGNDIWSVCPECRMPEDIRTACMGLTREKVAQAICKSRSCEGADCCQWPANGGRLARDCPVKRGGYDDAAQAAIDAVKVLSSKAPK
jgi:hypothetical protein